MKEYWRLNYEISPWLPKDSVWFREEDGEWGGESVSHGLGKASDYNPYWFTIMLEQERDGPSATRDGKPIINQVRETVAWVDIERKSE